LKSSPWEYGKSRLKWPPQVEREQSIEVKI
jgi:hypothetical protein